MTKPRELIMVDADALASLLMAAFETDLTTLKVLHECRKSPGTPLDTLRQQYNQYVTMLQEPCANTQPI